MIKKNPDVISLSGESEFYDIVQNSEKPVVVLFWDGEDTDLMRSMPMGMRWLQNYSEARSHFKFYKIQQFDAPALWDTYQPRGHEIFVFNRGSVVDQISGFVYASEICMQIMTHIDNKVRRRV
jgi:hypothetical protein